MEPTVKVTEPEVPPPKLVTEKLRVPMLAEGLIVGLAVICVELFTVVEFTVIPEPTFTELVPETKFIPVKTTLSVCPCTPRVGDIENKSTMGPPTVNVCEPDVPPPVLVTEKLRIPGVADGLIVRFAVICVELFTVVEFTAIPEPTFTELTPEMKFDPVKITFSVCPGTPLVGTIDVNVGVNVGCANTQVAPIPVLS